MIKVLLVLVLAAMVSGCVNARPARTIRVMTYNIHHGEGMDKRIDLERIAQVIQKEKADIVALQEVDKGVQRTHGRDLTAELAALTGMTGVFSNNFAFQGGEYGNAILSRFPILARTNTHYKMLRRDEQRGALQLIVNAHGKKLLFIDTHIDYRKEDDERILNVGELKQIVAQSKYPVIICGDFNCRPDSRPYKLMSAFLVDSWMVSGQGEGFTIPSTAPKSRIDYIWYSKDAFRSIKTWVPVTEASDHLPVVTELELR